MEKVLIAIYHFPQEENGEQRPHKGYFLRLPFGDTEVPTFFRLDIEKKIPFSKVVEKRRKTENENGSLNSVFRKGTRIPANPD